MGCMQWHLVINSPLDIVTFALQSPAVMISRAIFVRIKVNLYNVKETYRETFGSQVNTGYRIVSCADTSRHDFQHYIFPDKINIIGLGLNGMYAVKCGY